MFNLRSETFNPQQLDVLRVEYSRIDRIDPLSPTFKKMTAALDSMSPGQLRQIRDAKIRFLSRLAMNRVR